MLYVASGVSRDKHLLECSVGRDWDKPRNIVSVPPKSGRLATMHQEVDLLLHKQASHQWKNKCSSWRCIHHNIVMMLLQCISD